MSDLKYFFGLLIMIGSIFILCSATAFKSWIALIPAIGSLPVFFLGLRISIDGANEIPSKPEVEQ